MKSWRSWLGVLAWIAATALVVLLIRRVDPARMAAVFATANPAWFIIAVLGHAAIQPLSALEWRLLLPKTAPVPFARLLRVFALTSVANNTTPAIVGHVGVVVLVSAEPGVGSVAGLSMFALDQLCVGIVKLAVIVAAMQVAPLPDYMSRGAVALGAVLLAFGAMLAAFAFYKKRLLDLEAIKSRRFPTALLWTVSARAAELGAILAVQASFGVEPSWRSGIVVLAATSVASLVPFVPANIGVYEASVFAAYRILGVPDDTALAMAALQHASQLLPAVGLGYLLLTYERFTKRAAVQRP